MKKLILPILLFCACQVTAQTTTAPNIYGYSIPAAGGDSIRFSQFAGKKILIVNTASLAADKQQISQLQTLQQNHASSLVVIAVPCDDFNNLEPEDNNATLLQHYQQQFGISYPVAAKLQVTGTAIHPLFVFLTDKNLNGIMDSRVKGNFQKYLLDENGRLLAVFAGSVNPLSEMLQQALQQ